MQQLLTTRKQRGQTMIIIAFAVVALIALVALAVDGSNAYAQRRVAQNAVDGASLAGGNQMQTIYWANRNPNNGNVKDITQTQDHQIYVAISSTLAANHADTVDVAHGGTFESYYIRADGSRADANPIGSGDSVPFMSDTNPQGAVGVWVKSMAQSPTYFARLIGVNTVQSDAHGGAAIRTLDGACAGCGGGNNGAAGPKLWPITLMQNNINLHGSNVLFSFADPNGPHPYGPGNWGALCFTGNNCGNNEWKDWMANGFQVVGDPHGPLMLPTGPDEHNSSNDPTQRNFYPIGWDGINHNDGSNGTWQEAFTGNVPSSICNGSNDVLQRAKNEHWHVFVPVTAPDQNGNAINDYLGNGNGNGSNLRYHVVNLALFEITDANCPGDANMIRGTFLGYTWPTGQAHIDPNLGKAKINGQIVLELIP